MVRIPDWWKAGRPPRPQVTVRIGEAKGNLLGADSLLDFKVQMSLEGEPLTESELKAILQSASGLVLLKGKWVEVDRDKLQEVLDHWKKVQAAAGSGGMPLLEGLRLLSGFDGRPSWRTGGGSSARRLVERRGRRRAEEAARRNAAAGGFRRVGPGPGFAGDPASVSAPGRALALVHESAGTGGLSGG